MDRIIHIDFSEERQMRFGIGLAKIADIHWAISKLAEKAHNAACLAALKSNTINGAHVIRTLDGSVMINQVWGYSRSSGMYCYLVNRDGTLTRAI